MKEEEIFRKLNVNFFHQIAINAKGKITQVHSDVISILMTRIEGEFFVDKVFLETRGHISQTDI